MRYTNINVYTHPYTYFTFLPIQVLYSFSLYEYTTYLSWWTLSCLQLLSSETLLQCRIHTYVSCIWVTVALASPSNDTVRPQSKGFYSLTGYNNCSPVWSLTLIHSIQEAKFPILNIIRPLHVVQLLNGKEYLLRFEHVFPN